MLAQRPRVFISYTWERDEVVEWVRCFVKDLRDCGIEMVYVDRDSPGTSGTWGQKEGQINALVYSMMFCHAFLPIFTPDYVEAIGYKEGMRRSSTTGGWALDEFQMSIQLGQVHRIETVPILREGTFDQLPPGFHEKNTLDLRSIENYRSKLSYLARYLKHNRAVKVVPDLVADDWGRP